MANLTHILREFFREFYVEIFELRKSDSNNLIPIVCGTFLKEILVKYYTILVAHNI